MAPKVKEAMSWMSDAVETAAGWAIVVVAAYGLLFVDMTGNGRLWDAIRGVAQDSAPAKTPGNVAVQIRRVPARPADYETKAQNRMLLVPEVPDKEIEVAVAAPQPEAMTDAPADAHAGKDWRVHLKGDMRKFAVYGKGEERSSASAAAASAPAGAPRAQAVAVSAPTPAISGSAYSAGAAAEARPGIGNHVTRVTDGASDGVRNFRGR